MTTLPTRDVGDQVRLTYHAYLDGVLTDATVALTVTSPTGSTSTPSVTHASTGTYTAAFTLTSAGPWLWSWAATGAVVDVQDGEVTAVTPVPIYALPEQLKPRLTLASTDTTRDDDLLLALDTASRDVEDFCDHRVFYLAATASARVFDAGRWVDCTDQGERLDVDDIGALDGLLVEVGDGTTYTTVTDAQTYPLNALAKGQPITAILSPTVCLRYQRKMRVTARWGWPAIPSKVVTATLLQAGRLYRRPSSPEGVAGSADWGLVRVPNVDPDVQALLRNYRKVQVA